MAFDNKQSRPCSTCKFLGVNVKKGESRSYVCTYFRSETSEFNPIKGRFEGNVENVDPLTFRQKLIAITGMEGVNGMKSCGIEGKYHIPAYSARARERRLDRKKAKAQKRQESMVVKRDTEKPKVLDKDGRPVVKGKRYGGYSNNGLLHYGKSVEVLENITILEKDDGCKEIVWNETLYEDN